MKSLDCKLRTGMALHKMIRLVTMALGGEGWLNFMGNEFGHPEWIDFPREGNSWSHQFCRRQWSLADTDHLRYSQLNKWDLAMNRLDAKYCFASSPFQVVSEADDKRQLLVCERGPLLFVFNFSPSESYKDVKVCSKTALYRLHGYLPVYSVTSKHSNESHTGATK